MSGEGFVTGGGEGFKTGFYCGNGGIRDHRGKGMGFISHHEIERELVRDRMRAVIMSEFCVGDRFGPRCGVIAAKDTEVGFNFLIDSFRFAIGLWVIGSGKREVVVEEFFKFPGEGRCELGAMIRDDLIKESEAKENFMEKEGGDSLSGDRFLGRAKNHPLSKSMVYHDQERIKVRGDREIHDEITGNLLEGTGGNRFNGRQGGYGGVCVSFVLLAEGTALDIAADEGGKARPPELGGNKLACF